MGRSGGRSKKISSVSSRSRALNHPKTKEERLEQFDLDTYLDDWAADWSRLSPKVLDLIIEKAAEVQEESRTYKFLDCGEASSAWYKVFKEAGIEVRKVVGVYHENLNENGQIEDEYGTSDPPGSSHHAWLEVEGWLLDPTASQFVFSDRPFSKENYFIEEYFDGDPEDEDNEDLWKRE